MLDSVSVSGIVSSIISSIIVSLTGQLKMFEDRVSASLCETAPGRNVSWRIVHLGSGMLLVPGMKRPWVGIERIPHKGFAVS